MKATAKSAGRFSGRCLAAAIIIGCIASPLSAESRSSFGNNAISLEWKGDGHLTSMRIADHLNGGAIAVTFPFRIELADGTILDPQDLTPIGEPHAKVMTPKMETSRLAERKERAEYEAKFIDKEGRFQIGWRLIQVAGATYLRSEVTTTALKQDELIRSIDLFDAEEWMDLRLLLGPFIFSSKIRSRRAVRA
jgi:hypothetical protein